MTNVFIISAPSGSGKSTLVSRLLASDPDLLFSVSYTTRGVRGNEVPGESYVYISREEFCRRVAQGEFLEHAEVFGNFYGTHQSVLEQAQSEGRDLILDIDVQSEDSEAVIQRRLREAADEIRNHDQYDFILVNHQVEESVGTLAAIIRAERVRRFRMEDKIRPILESFEVRHTKV